MTSTDTASRICHHRTVKVGRILEAIRRLQHDDGYRLAVEAGDEAAAKRMIVKTAGVNVPSVDTWAIVADLLERDGRYVS